MINGLSVLAHGRKDKKDKKEKKRKSGSGDSLGAHLTRTFRAFCNCIMILAARSSHGIHDFIVLRCGIVASGVDLLDGPPKMDLLLV